MFSPLKLLSLEVKLQLVMLRFVLVTSSWTLLMNQVINK